MCILLFENPFHLHLFQKATDLGVPVIKINGHTMLVYDDRFEENREICIEYGEVKKLFVIHNFLTFDSN